MNAKEKKVALQVWAKKDDSSFEFSSPEGEQRYAITVKVPALLVEFRRYLAFEKEGEKLSYAMRGTLYPGEGIIIYNIDEVETVKPRKPRKGKDKGLDEKGE